MWCENISYKAPLHRIGLNPEAESEMSSRVITMWVVFDDVDLIIVEPLREFYKDEVRDMAKLLGIPSSNRQPFPGPGLAVRVLGDLTRERTEACRKSMCNRRRGIGGRRGSR